MKLETAPPHETAVIKSKIEYLEGFEEKTAIFESFKNLPISAGFSWGRESGTMSYKWKDEVEDVKAVRQRIEEFTRSLTIKYPGVMHMLGVLEGTQEQIQAVDSSDINPEEEETIIKANFIYTFDPDLAIVIRPADCPISIVYGKTVYGKNLAGLIHSSGVSVNAGIPRMAIEHLLHQEDVDPQSISIGITPGISRENYSIDEELTATRSTHPIVERNWMQHIDRKKTDSDKEKRHVDILRATIMQFSQADINPEQIEAYDVDTFNAHKQGFGFSHRLYSVSEKSEKIKPGRYMIALKLLK